MESLSTNILETCIVLYAHFSYSGIPAGDGGGRYEPELLITVAPPVCCRIYRLISYADLCLQPSKSSVSAPVTDISLYLHPPSPLPPPHSPQMCMFKSRQFPDLKVKVTKFMDLRSHTFS